MRILIILIILVLIACFSCQKQHIYTQNIIKKDSIVYVYDTVYIHHYVDTIIKIPAIVESEEKIPFRDKFGVGPNIGMFYSPYTGFDVIVGFGIQYNITQPSKIFKGRSRSGTRKHYRLKHSIK